MAALSLECPRASFFLIHVLLFFTDASDTHLARDVYCRLRSIISVFLPFVSHLSFHGSLAAEIEHRAKLRDWKWKILHTRFCIILTLPFSKRKVALLRRIWTCSVAATFSILWPFWLSNFDCLLFYIVCISAKERCFHYWEFRHLQFLVLWSLWLSNFDSVVYTILYNSILSVLLQKRDIFVINSKIDIFSHWSIL